MDYVTAHGARIPALGFGTFRLTGNACRQMVHAALAIGYRHIDTAQMYGNEAEVGDAIDTSGVPREEIWLTTKVWPDRFADGALQRSVEDSVAKLKTKPDLILLHWPSREVPLAETMRALNEVKARGLTAHIGVSNFNRALVEEAWSLSDAPLIMNQVEYHPYLDQSALRGTLRDHGMALTAYAPIAHGQVFGDPVLRRIGERHGKSPGQVTLRWLIQQGEVCAIPKSAREDRARTNFEIFDFELTDQDMAEIGALAQPDGRLIDPAGYAPDWD